jgi:hypothetical protein
MAEGELVQLPVRMKIEEGAKGEVKCTVAIDGDDADMVRIRLVDAYAKLKSDLRNQLSP